MTSLPPCSIHTVSHDIPKGTDSDTISSRGEIEQLIRYDKVSTILTKQMLSKPSPEVSTLLSNARSVSLEIISLILNELDRTGLKCDRAEAIKKVDTIIGILLNQKSPEPFSEKATLLLVKAKSIRHFL